MGHVTLVLLALFLPLCCVVCRPYLAGSPPTYKGKVKYKGLVNAHDHMFPGWRPQARKGKQLNNDPHANLEAEQVDLNEYIHSFVRVNVPPATPRPHIQVAELECDKSETKSFYGVTSTELSTLFLKSNRQGQQATLIDNKPAEHILGSESEVGIVGLANIYSSRTISDNDDEGNPLLGVTSSAFIGANTSVTGEELTDLPLPTTSVENGVGSTTEHSKAILYHTLTTTIPNNEIEKGSSIPDNDNTTVPHKMELIDASSDIYESRSDDSTHSIDHSTSTTNNVRDITGSKYAETELSTPVEHSPTPHSTTGGVTFASFNLHKDQFTLIGSSSTKVDTSNLPDGNDTFEIDVTTSLHSSNTDSQIDEVLPQQNMTGETTADFGIKTTSEYSETFALTDINTIPNIEEDTTTAHGSTDVTERGKISPNTHNGLTTLSIIEDKETTIEYKSTANTDDRSYTTQYVQPAEINLSSEANSRMQPMTTHLSTEAYETSYKSTTNIEISSKSLKTLAVTNTHVPSATYSTQLTTIQDHRDKPTYLTPPTSDTTVSPNTEHLTTLPTDTFSPDSAKQSSNNYSFQEKFDNTKTSVSQSLVTTDSFTSGSETTQPMNTTTTNSGSEIKYDEFVISSITTENASGTRATLFPHSIETKAEDSDRKSTVTKHVYSDIRSSNTEAPIDFSTSQSFDPNPVEKATFNSTSLEDVTFSETDKEHQTTTEYSTKSAETENHQSFNFQSTSKQTFSVSDSSHTSAKTSSYTRPTTPIQISNIELKESTEPYETIKATTFSTLHSDKVPSTSNGYSTPNHDFSISKNTDINTDLMSSPSHVSLYSVGSTELKTSPVTGIKKHSTVEVDINHHVITARPPQMDDRLSSQFTKANEDEASKTSKTPVATTLYYRFAPYSTISPRIHVNPATDAAATENLTIGSSDSPTIRNFTLILPSKEMYLRSTGKNHLLKATFDDSNKKTKCGKWKRIKKFRKPK